MWPDYDAEGRHLAARLADMPRLPDAEVPPLLRTTARWAAKRAAELLGAARVPEAVFVKDLAGPVAGSAVPGADHFTVGLSSALDLKSAVHICGHESAHCAGIEGELAADEIALKVMAKWRADVGARYEQILDDMIARLRRQMPHTIEFLQKGWTPPSDGNGLHPLDRPGYYERLAKHYGGLDRALRQMRLENELEGIALDAWQCGRHPNALPQVPVAARLALPPRWS